MRRRHAPLRRRMRRDARAPARSLTRASPYVGEFLGRDGPSLPVDPPDVAALHVDDLRSARYVRDRAMAIVVSESRDAGQGTVEPSAAIAFLLAFGAGVADAIGYLGCAKVFVAHMSGNTAGGAIQLVQGSFVESLRRLAPIGGFVAGMAAGEIASHELEVRRFSRRVAAVLSFEVLSLCLVFGMSAAGLGREILAISLAGAMGVQNAALRHAAGHQVRTTFVSGMLIALVDETLRLLRANDPAARRGVWLHGGVWLVFFGGALLGGVGFSRFAWNALALPIAALVAAIALDLRRPRPA